VQVTRAARPIEVKLHLSFPVRSNFRIGFVGSNADIGNVRIGVDVFD
jgi:hypothetical protein